MKLTVQSTTIDPSPFSTYLYRELFQRNIAFELLSCLSSVRNTRSIRIKKKYVKPLTKYVFSIIMQIVGENSPIVLFPFQLLFFENWVISVKNILILFTLRMKWKKNSSCQNKKNTFTPTILIINIILRRGPSTVLFTKTFSSLCINCSCELFFSSRNQRLQSQHFSGKNQKEVFEFVLWKLMHFRPDTSTWRFISQLWISQVTFCSSCRAIRRWERKGIHRSWKVLSLQQICSTSGRWLQRWSHLSF